MNASGIDYTGDGEGEVDENSAAGTSFLARVCVEWEAAARRAEEHGVRVVCMRTPLVITREALALKLMALPFRLFAGGPLGNGRQWFPWVHITDAVDVYRRASRTRACAASSTWWPPKCRASERRRASSDGRCIARRGCRCRRLSSASHSASRPTCCCTGSSRARRSSTTPRSATRPSPLRRRRPSAAR